MHHKGVAEKFVTVLPMNEATEVEGVQVTPIDANHCPGAAMLHFHDPATGATVLPSATSEQPSACPTRTYSRCLQVDDHDAVSGHHLRRPQAQVPRPGGGVSLDGQGVRRSSRESEDALRVPTYQGGKENAVEAVVKAAGSKAHVTRDRAHARLSARWDDTLYTETDAEDVRVRVASMAGETTHEDLAEKLNEFNEARWTTRAAARVAAAEAAGDRFNALIAFRQDRMDHDRRDESRASWTTPLPSAMSTSHGSSQSELRPRPVAVAAVVVSVLAALARAQPVVTAAGWRPHIRRRTPNIRRISS